MKLVINKVCKSFGEKNILKDSSFKFEKGRIYGLLGRNGAGKTTLFNCISNELSIDKGGIYIEKDNKQKVLSDEEIGYCYSEPILPEFLTGYEFLKFYIDINKDKIKDLLSIEEYLDIVKFKIEDSYRLIKSYSKGMKNKIQMLCFIITKPDVILLDEPLTSLDVVASLEMKNFLKSIKKDHIIIFSTHILELAMDLCDEVVVLNNGELQEVDDNILHSKDFEERIIDMLKEDN